MTYKRHKEKGARFQVAELLRQNSPTEPKGVGGVNAWSKCGPEINQRQSRKDSLTALEAIKLDSHWTSFESVFLLLEDLIPFQLLKRTVTVSTTGSSSALFSTPLSCLLPLKDVVTMKNGLCICLKPSQFNSVNQSKKTISSSSKVSLPLWSILE